MKVYITAQYNTPVCQDLGVLQLVSDGLKSKNIAYIYVCIMKFRLGKSNSEGPGSGGSNFSSMQAHNCNPSLALCTDNTISNSFFALYQPRYILFL